MTSRLVVARPDDAHLHLRDGAAMVDAVAHAARVFGRAVVMPNLKPAIHSTAQAEAYRGRILSALPEGSPFEPLMTLYLRDVTPPAEIARAAASPCVIAAKLYPAGATTHSEEGVTDLEGIAHTLEAMETHGMPLLVHGEVTDPAVDVFDREKVFLERILEPLVRRHEGLRVVLEHVTTREGVAFVEQAPARIAATLTVHHLLLDRGAMFSGGLDAHHYCLPVLKRAEDRQALLDAATGDDPRFFLGSDSAPHPRSAKERRGAAAGIFTGHAALELYAEVFEAAGALDRLEGFASRRAADFYGLPRSGATVTLVREPWRVPASYPFGDGEVVPLRAGETIAWRVVAS
jgi:dihydroorotase